MGIRSKIEDGNGTRQMACVTKRGQLVVGPLAFSEAYNVTLGTASLPGNIATPKANKSFIITALSLYANKNVGINDAAVEIYENSVGPAGATQEKIVFQTELQKNSSRDITPLNLEITTGKWLNAVTDDDDVFITVMGYYIE
jgi:hypothetical protein